MHFWHLHNIHWCRRGKSHKGDVWEEKLAPNVGPLRPGKRGTEGRQNRIPEGPLEPGSNLPAPALFQTAASVGGGAQWRFEGGSAVTTTWNQPRSSNLGAVTPLLASTAARGDNNAPSPGPRVALRRAAWSSEALEPPPNLSRQSCSTPSAATPPPAKAADPDLRGWRGRGVEG